MMRMYTHTIIARVSRYFVGIMFLVQNFLTPIRVSGSFANAMTSCAASLHKHASWLTSYLSVFLRDDMRPWATASGTDPASALQLNVDAVLARIRTLAAIVPEGQSPSVDQVNVVHELIAAATADTNLAKMDPMWHAWF